MKNDKLSSAMNFLIDVVGGEQYVKKPIYWISSGSYMLNACMSGSIFGGMPSGHMVMISGEPKSGKTYIVLDILREAQNMNHVPIVFDTENAHTEDRYEAQGIDWGSVKYDVPDTVDQVTVPIVKLTQKLFEYEKEIDKRNAKKKVSEEAWELPRYIVSVDSVTSLSSSKQLSDAIKGDMKTDMGTVARELKTMYNLIIPRLGRLNIPMICTAHTYDSQGSYVPTHVLSGGKGSIYMPSIVLYLRKRVEKDKETKEKLGIHVTVTVDESRFSCQRSANLYISFKDGLNKYAGLEDYCTWENVGICKGTHKNAISLHYELKLKKMIGAEKDTKTIFSSKVMYSALALAKKQLLIPTIHDNIHRGWIEVVGYVDDEHVNFKFTDKYFKEQEQDVERKILIPDDKSGTWIVKHLGQVMTQDELYNSDVFSQEVLEKLDEVIKPYFVYGSSLDDVIAKDEVPATQPDFVFDMNE